MARFLREPEFRHDTPNRTAVVLINLGTPEAPTGPALRRYLKEFLSDPRVVEIPTALWKVILYAFVLPRRPQQSAEKYASIWTPDGSPLRIHTERLAKLVRGFLGNQGHDVDVVHAMRYGQPSIPAVLEQLRATNTRRILLVPLYPQYAASTSATALDTAFSFWTRCRNQPEVRSVRSFPDDPGYIAALAASIRAHWMENGQPDDSYRLVMSFHGVPRRTLNLGDPYHCECQKTGRLLREALGLTAGQSEISFQSRFGRAEWLQPYTTATLARLAREGIRRVDIVCPGFVGDCLETLEEIAIEGKSTFIANGGKVFSYIPCLNTRPEWVRALSDLVQIHLSGWPTRARVDAQALQATATRARQIGAKF